MVGIHEDYGDAVNDMGLIHREWYNSLCWHAHVLDQQRGGDGAAVHHSAAEGPVQACMECSSMFQVL